MNERRNSKYLKLENHIPEMGLLSQERTNLEMTEKAERYFNGFGDKIFSIQSLAEGIDSYVYMVKMKDFPQRTNLVKLYESLSRKLRDPEKLIRILKNYYEVLESVRQELKSNNNPLDQKCEINGEEFAFKYSIAQSGILVEKNGEVASWVRNWIPGKNFQIEFRAHEERWEVHAQVKKLCEYLSGIYGFEINPCRMNYKIDVEKKSKIINVVFTDLADSIQNFMENIK